MAVVTRRPERPDDAAFRLALFGATHGSVLAGLDPALVEMLLAHQMAGQAATYAARYPAAEPTIVERDSVPIGRMVVDQTKAAVTLVDIALLPAWRGQGIGTRLARELLAEAGGRPVRLSVAVANVAARRLYEKLGFTDVGATEMDVAMEWTG